MFSLLYEAKAFETIYTHTISYIEQKINQDQGRKQTAERLNFCFFLSFFTVEGSFLVRTVKRRSVKTFFSTHYIFLFNFHTCIFINSNAARNCSDTRARVS